jgi:3-phenylpropionate/trans-cinnamate dioxygenase ferredoxin subunit
LEKTSVGKTSDFTEGHVLGFRIEGNDVAVVKWQDSFFAFRNLCTHSAYSFDHLNLRPDGCLTCVGHFAVFNIQTGEPIEGPTSTPLPLFNVSIEADEVFVSQ